MATSIGKRSVAAGILDGFLDLLFPPKCLVCGAHGTLDLCDPCRKGFNAITPPLCERCGVSTDGVEALCPLCAEGPGWSFVAARAAGHFSGPLRAAILRLKYSEKRRLAAPLGAYLGEYLAADPFRGVAPELLVPVPLHRSRLRERGFNQSALIAREAARILDLPLADDLLIRTRRTRPQAELHAAERALNIRDAFAADESGVLRRKSVLLIDDVLTTMHTVDECARVLMDAGARAVCVAAVARGS